jgi:hypothetical protein
MMNPTALCWAREEVVTTADFNEDEAEAAEFDRYHVEL